MLTILICSQTLTACALHPRGRHLYAIVGRAAFRACATAGFYAYLPYMDIDTRRAMAASREREREARKAAKHGA